jgi:hypothetical protein
MKRIFLILPIIFILSSCDLAFAQDRKQVPQDTTVARKDLIQSLENAKKQYEEAIKNIQSQVNTLNYIKNDSLKIPKR